MSPESIGALSASAAAVIATMGFGLNQIRASNAAAREAGARDEREKHMQAEIGRVKADGLTTMSMTEERCTAAVTALALVCNTRHEEVSRSLHAQDEASRAFERFTGRVEEHMNTLSRDVSEMKTTVGGLGKEMEQTFRNLIIGKYDKPSVSARRSAGAAQTDDR